MKSEIESLFKKIKASLSELLHDDICDSDKNRIEETNDEIIDYLSDLEDEITSIEEDKEQAEDSLTHVELSTENYIYELLDICKEVFETNGFSVSNINKVNKIAMKTNNDSKLLWDHNKK